MKSTLVILFVVKFFLLLYVFDPEIPVLSDENSYYYSALNINKYNVLTNDRNGDMFHEKKPVSPTLSLLPGYPLYLSLMFEILGDSVIKVRVFNIVFYLLLMVYFCLYGKLFRFKFPVVVFGLFLFILYPGLSYNVSKLLTENIFCLLIFAGTYHVLRALKKDRGILGSNFHYLLGNILLVYSILVRPHGLIVFALVISCFILLMIEVNTAENLKPAAYSFFVSCGIFLLIMSPWWIRNWTSFGKIVLLSYGGEGPKIWGAVPYFLDMISTLGKGFDEVQKISWEANKLVYLKWRIFGFIQYMWGDIWDEYLVHKFNFFKPFIVLQYIFVVPVLMLTPFFIKYTKSVVLLLFAVMPFAFTFINMRYHGLPRYVWPSIPFIVVALTYSINHFFNKGQASFFSENVDQSYISCGMFPIKYKIIHIILSLSFWSTLLTSVLIAYSVYIFPWSIRDEMVSYRLGKYLSTNIDEVKKDWIVQEKLNIKKDHLVVHNYKEIRENDRNGSQNIGSLCLRGMNSVPMTVTVNLPENSSLQKAGDVVTEIDIRGRGGYIFDYMTIYWIKDGGEDKFSEDQVYSFPTHFAKKKHKVLIDGNVNKILIVPFKFRGGKFCLDAIEVKKYTKSN